MATIQHVAERAGVSASTVSHVVNGTRAVGPETERRVREAIVALGYRPNLLARGLRRQVSQTLALLVPDLTDPFAAALARAVEVAGFARGYGLALGNTGGDPARTAAYLETLLAKRVDGLILLGADLPDLPAADGTAANGPAPAGPPRVVVGPDPGEELGDAPPVDRVLVDDALGGRLAAEHLLGLGHRRVACLGAAAGETGGGRGPTADWQAGLRAALAEAGAPLEPGAEAPDPADAAAGAAAVAGLLAGGTPFTALAAASDALAVGAVAALRAAGRRVPEDVSVVGYGGGPLAARFAPELTTVARPAAEAGRRALDLLLDRLARRTAPPARLVLPPALVARGTTAPPPA